MKPLSKALEHYVDRLIILHEQLNRSQQKAMLNKLDLALSEWEIEKVVPPISQAAKFELTPSQSKAFAELKKFAVSRSIKYFRLVGYAGTGKSFLIAEFIKWLQSQQLDYVVAAPTNKATKNIKSIASIAGVQISVMTVAQLLGQQPQLNEETGIEEFTTNSKGKLDCDIVIIDEFSMISSTNFTDLEKAISANTKILFVGDAAQLPPVGESESIVAVTPAIAHESTLTEVVRYDGEIGKVAEQIRTESHYQTTLYPFRSTADESIICLPYQEWLTEAAQMIKSPQWKADPNYCRILVWRNNTAESLNNWMRIQLWGADASPFEIGDRLIAKKPVFREAQAQESRSSLKKKKEWHIIINNSEECAVVGESKLEYNSQFSWYQIPVISEAGSSHLLKILTPESEAKRQELMKEYRVKKEWYKAADLDKAYDYCPYAYCLTIHKAQGSSIDRVFLHAQDLRGSSDLQKLQYTGLTRTKVKAYVLITQVASY
jgi:AAA domain/UvrD-like helicase C-terminal domain